MASMQQLKMGAATVGKQAARPALPMRSTRSTGCAFSTGRASSKVPQRLQQLCAVKEAGAIETGSSRWDSQIKDGRVGNVLAKDISSMLKEGWVLLDVRPPGETSVVSIDDAINVPLFVEDPSRDPYSLLKQASNFGMGGWWLGGTHMIANQNFLAEVQAKIPKDSKVIVGCQKGLRSLAACESMMRAGYTTVSWVNGGFDACRKGDLKTSPADKDIRYAGVGGVSSLLGWTDVQRDEKKEQLGGVSGVIQFFVVLLIADAALFVYEYADAYMKTGKLPWEL